MLDALDEMTAVSAKKKRVDGTWNARKVRLNVACLDVGKDRRGEGKDWND